MYIMYYDTDSGTFVTKESSGEESLEQTSPESYMTFMIAAKDKTTGLNVFTSDDECLMFDSKCWIYTSKNTDITCDDETIEAPPPTKSPTNAPTKAPGKAPSSPPSFSVSNTCDTDVDINIKYFDISTMTIREESASIAPDANYNIETTGKVSEMLVSQKIHGIDALAPYCDNDAENYMEVDGVCWKIQNHASDISYDYDPICDSESGVRGRILQVTSNCKSSTATKIKLSIREMEDSPGIPSVSGSKYNYNVKEGKTMSHIEDKTSSNNFYVAGKHLGGPEINSDIFKEKCKNNINGFFWITESLGFERCYRQIPKREESRSVSTATMNCFAIWSNDPVGPSDPSVGTDKPIDPLPTNPDVPPLSGEVCY